MGEPANEEAEIAEIVRGFLVSQSRTAADQNRPLRRGTHAKGVCVRAVFEVFDLRDSTLASRLAVGIYAKPCSYPAIVRFANSDPTVASDWVPDVRGVSFSVMLSSGGTNAEQAGVARQDYSLQSAPTLPFNDVTAFVVYAKALAAPNQAVALGSMSFEDQSVFARTNQAVIQQKRQPVRPYQQIRYWSNVPFRHGMNDVVKYSLTPRPDNPARPLDRDSPDALRDELIRHLNGDQTMSAFEFGLQFLDTERMTLQGRRRDANFWIENASTEWPEAQAPFHTVGRLTLLPKSQLPVETCEGLYIDVNGNSAAFHAPVGGVNRARGYAEAASRQARWNRGV